MSTNWNEAFTPLLRLYKGKKHPLDYASKFQLLVMVLLSAQDSDRHINQVAVEFFRAYPTMSELAKATVSQIEAQISSVRNFGNKAKWLATLAKTVGTNEAIPNTLSELTELPGIGRKSANVIIRESGGPAEGIIVDLHVVRVAPRLGVATGDKPEKIEKQLMETVDQENWGEVGMAISFLGREICRPTSPRCEVCPMNPVCQYYRSARS